LPQTPETKRVLLETEDFLFVDRPESLSATSANALFTASMQDGLIANA
jgi:hypothetical protein